jgi:hypothetical protein
LWWKARIRSPRGEIQDGLGQTALGGTQTYIFDKRFGLGEPDAESSITLSAMEGYLLIMLLSRAPSIMHMEQGSTASA